MFDPSSAQYFLSPSYLPSSGKVRDVIDPGRLEKVGITVDAVSKGARIVTGGCIPPHLSQGWYYEPTILTDCTPAMAIFREENFGPVAPIYRVKDFNEAMEAAERLEAGMVWVNNPLIDNDALPFGGWKASGLGRELSRMGLDVFRRSKMVIIDHKPARQDWWYPYPDDWFHDTGGRKRSDT